MQYHFLKGFCVGVCAKISIFVSFSIDHFGDELSSSWGPPSLLSAK